MQGTLVPPFRSSAVCTVFLPRDSRKVSAKPNSKPAAPHLIPVRVPWNVLTGVEGTTGS